ncbi:MAG: GNAT family N-acetyltransferase [Thermacetogeniaceae bacterium]
MGDRIVYGVMRDGEEKAISGLVSQVFDEFVAPGYDREGIDTFMDYTEPDAIALRSLLGHNFALTAKVGGLIVGAIEVRGYEHICLLFVDKSYQRRGIARELIRRAIVKCSKRTGFVHLSVNSSPFAIPFYTSMGFVQTDKEQLQDGIRYIPMLLAYK